MVEEFKRQSAGDAHDDSETTKRTKGQRRVNLIWELTQSGIALLSIGGAVIMMMREMPVPDTLSNMVFLVVGFYFARTNHTATGGVGRTHFRDQMR